LILNGFLLRDIYLIQLKFSGSAPTKCAPTNTINDTEKEWFREQKKTFKHNATQCNHYAVAPQDSEC